MKHLRFSTMMYHNHNLASMLLIILVSCLFNVRMATALGKDEDEGDLRASFTQGGQQQHQGEDELWEAKYMADKRARVSVFRCFSSSLHSCVCSYITHIIYIYISNLPPLPLH